MLLTSFVSLAFCSAGLGTAQEIAPPAARTVRGQVLIVHKDGSETLAGSGEVLVELFDKAPSGESLPDYSNLFGIEQNKRILPLVDGQWKLSGVRAASILVRSADIQNFGAYFPDSRQSRPDPNFPGETALLTRCNAIEGVTIRILDAWTRLPLEDIEILRSRAYYETRMPFEYREDITPAFVGVSPTVRVGSKQDSPLVLATPTSEWIRSIDYWVRTPKHAWARINLGHDPTENRIVLLHPVFGTLEVEVIASAETQYVLLIQPANRPYYGGGRAPGPPPAFASSSLVRAGLHVIKGVPPTRYQVSISKSDERGSIDRIVIFVSPGERARLTLTDPEPVERLRVEGHMAVDPTQMGILDPFGLVDFYPQNIGDRELWRRGLPCSVAAGEDWSIELPRGSYRAYLHGYGEVGRFEVPSSEPVTLRQESSDFAEVRLFLPPEITSRSIVWRSGGTPQGSGREEWSPVSPLKFIVPVGEIEMTGTRKYGEQSQYTWTRTVSAGGSEFQLVLPPLAGVVNVVLFENSELYDPEFGIFTSDLMCGDHYAAIAGGVAHFVGVEPGLHELHIPPIPGFWTPERRIIEVPKTGDLRIEVHLERVE